MYMCISYILFTHPVVVVKCAFEFMVGVGRLDEEPLCIFRGQLLASGGKLLLLLVRVNNQDSSAIRTQQISPRRGWHRKTQGARGIIRRL